jgi:hypothetical protein
LHFIFIINFIVNYFNFVDIHTGYTALDGVSWGPGLPKIVTISLQIRLSTNFAGGVDASNGSVKGMDVYTETIKAFTKV